MTAVSEMPAAEVQQHDPDLLRACSMTGSIRWLEIYRAYLLAERLDKAKPEESQGIIDAWGKAMGITPGTLASHLRWARLIHLEDLLAVFEEEGIPSEEWTARVGTSHLKLIGRAKDQGTTWEMPFTSRERAGWVRRAYHANLSVAELEDMLRDHDLLPPKRPGKLPPPSKTPNTSVSLLRAIADSLETQDKDLDLSERMRNRPQGQPIDIGTCLRWLGKEYLRLHPGVAFRIGEEEPN